MRVADSAGAMVAASDANTVRASRTPSWTYGTANVTSPIASGYDVELASPETGHGEMTQSSQRPAPSAWVAPPTAIRGNCGSQRTGQATAGPTRGVARAD